MRHGLAITFDTFWDAVSRRVAAARVIVMVALLLTPLLSRPAAASGDDAMLMERIRQADEYARGAGFVSGLPSFHCRDYYTDPNWTRMVCGTILFNTYGAERRWVPEAEFEPHDPARIGDRFSVASNWAAARGFRGAYPTFRVPPATMPPGRWVELVLLLPNATEFRDVPRKQLGDVRNEDWLKRFREAFQYALRQGPGWVTALPTGHEANYGAGVVYGTQLIRATGATWVDVPANVYGFDDVYIGPRGEQKSDSFNIEKKTSCQPPPPAPDSTEYFCGSTSDLDHRPAVPGKTPRRDSLITRFTNLTSYRMKFWFFDWAGQLQGQATLNPGEPTNNFDDKPLTGTVYALLDDYVYYNEPAGKQHGVGFDWLPPFEVIGAPRARPAAMKAPSPLLYYRIVSPSNRVLDVEANTCAAGGRVLMWPANLGDNQSWRFKWTGSGSNYVIENKASGAVLDVEAVSTQRGAFLHQWPRIAGAGNQEFSVDPLGNGSFRIRAVHSGKVLDVVNRSRGAGARVQQWDWLGGTDNWHQQWRLEPINDSSLLFGTLERRTCW